MAARLRGRAAERPSRRAAGASPVSRRPCTWWRPPRATSACPAWSTRSRGSRTGSRCPHPRSPRCRTASRHRRRRHDRDRRSHPPWPHPTPHRSSISRFGVRRATRRSRSPSVDHGDLAVAAPPAWSSAEAVIRTRTGPRQGRSGSTGRPRRSTRTFPCRTSPRNDVANHIHVRPATLLRRRPLPRPTDRSCPRAPGAEPGCAPQPPGGAGGPHRRGAPTTAGRAPPAPPWRPAPALSAGSHRRLVAGVGAGTDGAPSRHQLGDESARSAAGIDGSEVRQRRPLISIHRSG